MSACDDNKLWCPNIRFGTFERDIKGNHMKLDGFTVILVMSEPVSDEIVLEYARILIRSGCRDYGFCGVEGDKWHNLFDLTDIDITEDEEDYSTTWGIDSIEELPDQLCICKEEIFILCTDDETVKRCHRAITTQGYGFKVKYIGEKDTLAFNREKEYFVLSVEKGWYRILTDLDEDYLFPPCVFERVCGEV